MDLATSLFGETVALDELVMAGFGPLSRQQEALYLANMSRGVRQRRDSNKSPLIPSKEK